MSGRREAVLECEAERIRAKWGKAEAMPMDVSDKAAVLAAVEAIARRHGTIHILVNSAGLNATRRFWRDVSAEDFPWNTLTETVYSCEIIS